MSKPKAFGIIQSKWGIAVGAFALGALVILGLRFTTYKPTEETHYHANFVLLINGVREQFKSPGYYTDIEESCSEEQQISPHERAHMHDNINDVVHVEDEAVTWGQFFQNLGWVIDPMVVRTATQVLVPGTDNKVSFILNGKSLDNVTNKVIEDKDRLLIDYGNRSPADLQKAYKTVPATAYRYDVAQDPASCSGGQQTTMRDRMRHLF